MPQWRTRKTSGLELQKVASTLDYGAKQWRDTASVLRPDNVEAVCTQTVALCLGEAGREGKGSKNLVPDSTKSWVPKTALLRVP